jgi:RecB family exonuclease
MRTPAGRAPTRSLDCSLPVPAVEVAEAPPWHVAPHSSTKDPAEVGVTCHAAARTEGTRMAIRWHSVSSTREYELCPRRYRFGYLDRRPKDRPSPPSWRFGTVVHAALEAAWRAAMDAPAHVPVAAHLPVALAALDVALTAEGLTAPEDRARGISVVTRALEEDVLRDGAVDPDAPLEPARPIGVEEALRGRIGPTDRIIGFVDLVLEHPDGAVELVDHKVTDRRASEGELREDLQLNLYGQLARSRWPDAPAIIATLHYPTGPDRVSITLSPAGMARAEERVRDASRAIARDTEFVPVPSDACSHCPWSPSCPEGSAHIA